jgi:transcriptional regulator with XRE-family HTH domain
VKPSSEVREFLITRRARITPQQAGLPAYGANRRVKGLRREEVAMLAGVSVDYYTRLERGNLAGASESVLDALARALQLDEAERAHLFDLAGAAHGSSGATRRRTGSSRVRPGVQRVLDAMGGAPAWIRNGRADVLAANSLGRALYAPVFDDPARPANTARFTFLSPQAREFYRDWDRTSRDMVAVLRAAAAATRTTRPCRTWSASCPPAARRSARCGPRTTCCSTAPAARTCTTLWPGTWTSPMRRSSCRLTLA